MSLINSEWNNKTTVKKGSIGESIIREYLESQNFVIYRPITEKAHSFDKLAIRDKRQIIIAETKTKARRNYYPDTGINLKHYEEYKFISTSHKLPVFLFFVDEMQGQVYGNWLSLLEESKTVNIQGDKAINYPLIQNGIIYFPLSSMRIIQELNSKQVEELKNNSTRNYDYEQD